MKKQLFLTLLILIAFLGLGLRLLDYDRIPPFLETKDEFFYPWAGISFLQTGIPVAWANFASYPQSQTVTLWGESFRLVKPWIEKPPLYWLISGTISLLAAENEFYKVRLSTARLLPIFLNLISIIFIGLLTAKISDKNSALIATLFYATVPTIVLANRLNLTENLLILLSLATLYIYLTPVPQKFKSLLVGIGCAAALLTKNIGVALPLVILLDLFFKKQWRDLAIVGVLSFLGGIVHPLMGLFYNWDLYIGVLAEYRQAHALGLPETVASIFLFPVIGHKEKIILDGGMLTGYLVFFATLLKLKIESRKQYILLVFPAAYLAILALLEGGRTWFGWHLFPLYPFLMIFLGVSLSKLINEPEYLKFLLYYLILGASSLRFLLLTQVFADGNWQLILGVALFIFTLPYLAKNLKLKQFAVKIFLGLIILINILAIIKADSWYENRPQPLPKPLSIPLNLDTLDTQADF